MDIGYPENCQLLKGLEKKNKSEIVSINGENNMIKMIKNSG